MTYTSRRTLLGAAGLAFAAPFLPRAWAAPAGAEIRRDITVQLMSDHETNSWRGIIDQYNKLGRANVRLDVLGRAGFSEKLQIEMFGHSKSPDVLQFASNATAPYAAAGFLEPLDHYLQDASLTPKDFDFTDFIAASRESVSYRGKVYGFADDLSSYLLFYRTDLIKEPPKTWAEYYDVAKRFTQSLNAGSPTKYGTTMQGARGSLPPKEWAQTFWSYGGEFFDKNMRPQLTSKPAVQALTERMQMLREWKIVPPDAINYSYPETSTAFMQGLVAMCLQWNAAYPDLIDPAKNPNFHDKVKAAVVPGGIPFVQTQVWSVNAYSPNKLAAYDFLMWTRMRAQDVAYTLGTGGEPGTPCRASTLNDKQVLAKRPELAGLLGEIRRGRTFPQIAEWSKVQAALDQAIALGTTGQQAPEAALRAANDAIAAAVKA